MLTAQWQPPQDGGGAPFNYTITVSPGSTEVTTPSTSASLSAVPYNVINTISIVATNCNGSSSAVMETIRIGRLQCSLHVKYMTQYIHTFGDVIYSTSKPNGYLVYSEAYLQAQQQIQKVTQIALTMSVLIHSHIYRYIFHLCIAFVTLGPHPL